LVQARRRRRRASMTRALLIASVSDLCDAAQLGPKHWQSLVGGGHIGLSRRGPVSIACSTFRAPLSWNRRFVAPTYTYTVMSCPTHYYDDDDDAQICRARPRWRKPEVEVIQNRPFIATRVLNSPQTRCQAQSDR